MRCETMLDERGVMKIWESEGQPWKERRQELIKILLDEEYGYFPAESVRVTYETVSEEEAFCASKYPLKKIMLRAELASGVHEFPFYTMIPKGEGKYPFFIHINFRDDVPDRYMPVEEICDNGFALLSFCYTDVTSDDNDFTNGLAGVLYPGGKRESADAGKLRMWAWAASKILDYACGLEALDTGCATVVGHSRLGKTALLAGALDERFFCAISNDSGCSGAAITRDKTGERIADICRLAPQWFCENYYKYAGKESELPFDQHFLVAAIAPRMVCVGSAREDSWADPDSEYLSCVAANEVYHRLGLRGFVHPDRLPETGDAFQEGEIGYHLRGGTHYFSREDWLRYMDFINKKREKRSE